MTMLQVLSHEPLIFHLHPEYRPEDTEQRNDLIARACKNLHLKRRAQELLKYYASLNDGERQNNHLFRGHSQDRVVSSEEDARKALVACGLIYYEQYRHVKIDWDHIRLFALYIDTDKAAAFWWQVEAHKDDGEQGPSILSTMARHDFKQKMIGSDALLYYHIEDMSEAEFKVFLDHCMALDKVENAD